MSFKFLPDVAIADIAFEVNAPCLEDLFAEAGRALCEMQVDQKNVKPKVNKTIKLQNTSIDKLFFDWLAELIYMKDADNLIFSRFKINIKKSKESYALTAVAEGSKINYKTMKLRMDLKAVTYHMFEVKQDRKGWKARVVIDI